MPGAIFKWVGPLFDESSRRWNHDDVLSITKKLESFVSPEGRVLDLGGGTGRLGGLLATALRCDVTVFDSDPQMLRHAESLPRVSTQLCDASKLPFEDGAFDAVVVVDALHRFGHQKETLQEAARVLKQSGGVLVAESDPRTRSVWATGLIERVLGGSGSFISPPDLVRMFSDVGIVGSAEQQDTMSYVFVGTHS